MATWPEHKAALFSAIGYHEEANKWTKYGDWFGKMVHDSSYAKGDWCAMFQLKIAYDLGDIGGFGGINKDWAYVPSWSNYFLSIGQSGKTIVEGALAFFDFNHSGEPEHVGRVVQKTGRRTFKTVEGNTANQVAERDRDISEVLRFGYPKLSGAVDLLAVVSVGA